MYKTIQRMFWWASCTAPQKSKFLSPIVLALVAMGMIRFLGKGVFGEETKIGLVKTLVGHSKYVNSVVFSSDGKYLASGSDGDTINLWGIPLGELLETLKDFNNVISVAFSPDGKYLAFASGSGGDLLTRGDNSIKIWEVPISPPF